MKKIGRKVPVNSTVIVVTLTVIVVAVFAIILSRPASVEVTAQEVTISGIYGTSVPLSEITEVEMLHRMPGSARKVNGINIGPILRGQFNVENLGRGRLFVRSTQGDFLLIHTKESFVLFQGAGEEDIQRLHAEINSYLK